MGPMKKTSANGILGRSAIAAADRGDNPTSESAGLRLKISELARPNDNDEPGPLQFLREHTGFESILPSEPYTDEVGTYQTVMTRIGRLIPKSR